MDTTLTLSANPMRRGTARRDRPRVTAAETVAATREPRPWFGANGYDGGSAIGATLDVAIEIEMERWFFSANERIAFRAMVLAALRSSTRWPGV